MIINAGKKSITKKLIEKLNNLITTHNSNTAAHSGIFAPADVIVSSTTDLTDGEATAYPAGTLYVVFEEEEE